MDDLDAQNTPLVNLANDLLSEYNSSLRSLLGLLDTEGNRNTAPEASQNRIEASKKIVKLDENLQRLYGEIVQHQRRQEEIRQTQLLSIESGKAKLRFISNMLDAKSQLEQVVADAEKKLALGRVAKRADPKVAEIIEYAKKLSKFTMAPPNYDPNSGAVPPEPPYPVLVAMRAGVLSRYRVKKGAKEDDADEEDMEEGDYLNALDEAQFDDIDADDLLLSLDLNPDLD
ncbi:hypothetical protein GGI01_000142 [Coemansia sp. RSA 376]|nr:hypothetical protein LPJ71_007457 [Coemansia sp. S17]KAJ2015744.1 hypothetical protein GGI14_004080 [Coemansia sp. S680]KAJ2052305.1 hypothetical protein H4S04_001417 [Coemansia sp. S16]KAJ2053651.1 hypothetical protein GGI08_004770 [Coemansia sp. S2]KAJ2061509.1 hypothetical protein GGH13_006607 [Coemansia sp. S155-1]KAJ2096624.1 hypothetical protein GGI09_004260 [Coemansia sp. S100]KAJ2101744.1 hypothetical protein IW146_009265 [Coemansia sp. RSA 922]KAJ2264123.1 hypothetical protein GG